jgi:dTDP-glucose pyrophosphorylase
MQYNVIPFKEKIYNISDLNIELIINELKIKKYIIGSDINNNYGLLTRGDITKNIKYLYTKPSSEFWNFKFIYIKEICNSKINSIFLKYPNINIIPIIKYDNISQIVVKKVKKVEAKVACLISAGGKGERLGSLTKKTPKPLLYYNNKALIEYCLDIMIKNGINDFYISVCYKKEMVKNFLGNGVKYNVSINYLEEDVPLGTLGAINLKNWSSYDYIVLANSDLVFDFDLNNAISKMRNDSLDVLALSNLINTYVPYGLIDIDEDSNEITRIIEKPTLFHNVLNGIYIFNANLNFSGIPDNPPDYINKLINSGKKISNQIIYEDWLDLGQKECIKFLNMKN